MHWATENAKCQYLGHKHPDTWGVKMTCGGCRRRERSSSWQCWRWRGVDGGGGGGKVGVDAGARRCHEQGGGSWLGELLKDAFLGEFLQGALSAKSHLLILKKETLSLLFELMTKFRLVWRLRRYREVLEGEKVKAKEEVLASSFRPPQNGLGAEHGDALTERANGVGNWLVDVHCSA